MYIWSCRFFTKWSLHVEEELIKIGAKTSNYDPAVFYYYVKNEWQGALTAHVDDSCWGDNQTFIDVIISPTKKKFNVGSECSKTFHYLGLDLNPNERKQIYLNQTKCIKI